MSVTLLSLVLMGISAMPEIIRNTGIRPEHLLKASRPMLIQASKIVGDSIDKYTDAAKDAGWIKEVSNGQPCLKKYYKMSDTYKKPDIENEIVSYFEEMNNVYVIKTLTEQGCIIEAKSGMIRSAAGFKLNIKVEVLKGRDCVCVKYYSAMRETIEVLEAIVLSNPVSGIGKLAGAHMRHEIPLEIDKRVMGYFI